jgi:nitrogen fixation protein FixH
MKPATRWPVGITLMLAAMIATNAVLYYVAGADPSLAVEPSAHANAITWHSTVTQSLRTAAPDWHLVPTLSPFVPSIGARLSVTLADTTGAPITDATVRVSARHGARAGNALQSTLRPAARGYDAILGVTQPGEWEFHFDVTRNGQRFTSTVRLDARRGAPGA